MVLYLIQKLLQPSVKSLYRNIVRSNRVYQHVVTMLRGRVTGVVSPYHFPIPASKKGLYLQLSYRNTCKMWTAICYACQIFWTFMFCWKSVRENPFSSFLSAFLKKTLAPSKLRRHPCGQGWWGHLYHVNKNRAKSSLQVEYLSTPCTPPRDSTRGTTWQRPSINIGVLRFYCVTHNSLVLLPQNQSKDRRNLHTMSNSSFVQWWSAFRVYVKQVSTHCFSQASTFA